MKNVKVDIQIPLGRLGPASNLRPGGSHKQKRVKSRARIRVELRLGRED